VFLKKYISVFLAFSFVLLINFIGRSFIAADNLTGDLYFYIYGGFDQYNLYGFNKNYLYDFLKLSDLGNDKLLLLSLFQSFLFSLAVFATFFNTEQFEKAKESNFIFNLVVFSIIASSAVFFMQLDMHLVRQQTAIYFFILGILQKNIFFKFIFLSAAIFFHEITLPLIFGYFFYKYFFNKSIIIFCIMMFPLLIISFLNSFYQILFIHILGFVMFVLAKNDQIILRAILLTSVSIGMLISLMLVVGILPTTTGERGLMATFVVSFFSFLYFSASALKTDFKIGRIYDSLKILTLLFYGIFYFAY
tara:strand:- start:2547 stop:3461 length:915 start_codon:yes stop_codon:yes gene_type:complete